MRSSYQIQQSTVTRRFRAPGNLRRFEYIVTKDDRKESEFFLLLRLFILLCFLFALFSPAIEAQSGFVKSADQPIPGAVVTISQSGKTLSTVTDADGHYVFPALAPGAWTVDVDMFGFDRREQQVDYSSAKGPVNFNLQLKESPMAKRLQEFAQRRNAAGPNQPASTQQIDQEIQNALNTQPQGFSENTSASLNAPNTHNTSEAFLVSGSLSPGMAEGRAADSGPDMRFQQGGLNGGDITGQDNPAEFGQGRGGPGGGGGFGGRGGGGFGRGGGGPRGGRGQTAGAAFGNRSRRNQQIHGQASFSLTNSALNAKPFSINGLDIPQAAYAQSRFSLILGGPLVLPKIVKDPSTQFFISYFGTRARTPQLFTETVPTAAERQGDFSQAGQSLGTSATNVPVTIVDPATRQPVPNNTLTNLNPISLALLRYYPLPNEPGSANNYQFETAQASNSDNVGVRIQRNITKKDRLALNFQYQDRSGTVAQWYGVSDASNGYGLNTRLQWTRNITASLVSSAQVRFNRSYGEITPFFSQGSNVEAELGIPGSASNPLDYGPPTLNFTNFASLSDSTASLTRNQAQSGTESITLLKGLHSITLGVSFTRADLATRTDPNGRGTFSFTGVQTSQLNANGQPVNGTGYDLADFLLGLPQSSSIRYGDSSIYFNQNQTVAYVQDEWKLRSNFTLTLGLRYEYFTPFAEKYGRMANLDIAPDFTNVAVALPNQSAAYTGVFPSGLINPDHNNWAPRVALAWKLPWTKRSTIVRAGYGIYYNEQAYGPLAQQLAQQPPFAVSNAVNTSSGNVLTLERGFLTTSPQDITNTFAVDRFYRTPYAGTWTFSIQHDLPGGFFAEAGYMGTKGTGLDVRILPNEPIPGSSRILTQQNQLGNAVGFTFDEPVGNSTFNALQLRTIRRFNHGLSFNVFYQFAKSIDDSSTFGGAGNTVAQNWLDISAERGLSSFDVRHELQTSFVWTSPVAGPGSHIAPDGKLGRLLKDWQLSGNIAVQSGNPLTARVLGNTAQLAQTGGIGSQRAEATGQPIDSGSGNFNLNAFTVPPSGSYGDAGRNTIPGPGVFSLNLGFARSFNLAERKRLEFRFESNNILNHVNYTNLYTVVNAVNYGLPSAAGAMRTMSAVVRFRF